MCTKTLSLLLLWLLLRTGPITYAIVPAPGDTYGYDIFSNGRKLIHQTSIPGLPGNSGFVRRRDAARTARLVIYKLQHNIEPPSVSRHELDSLKIHYH